MIACALLLVASPLDQLGFSSADAALASSVIAAPHGAAAAFYNPALAAGAKDFQGAAGYSYTALRFSVNAVEQDLDAASALHFALVSPTSLGRFGDIGLSFAASIPDRRLVRARVVPSEVPRFLMYDNRLQRVEAAAAVSYARSLAGAEVGLALGLGLLAGAAGNGTTFWLRQSGDYQRADAKVNAELPLVTTPLAAAFFARGPWRAGLLVRGPIEFAVAVGTLADIRFSVFEGDVYSAVLSTDFYTPLKLAAGGAWQSGDLSLYAAVEMHRWSVAPPLTALAVIKVQLAGVPVSLPETKPTPQDLRDVYIARVGAEKRVSLGSADFAWRAGAFFEPSPIGLDAPSVFFDADRVGASVGAGVTTPAVSVLALPLSVDAHVLGVQLLPRRFRAAGPTDLRPDLRITGYLLSTGVTLTLRF